MISHRCEAIGVVRSCFPEKFGVPQQPRLVPAATARLDLYEPYATAETIRGLSVFSHIWVIFLFHQTLAQGWRPLVRPPRLGGRKRVGVFASRSPFRPNPIGISAVELVAIDLHEHRASLLLRGVDLVDGTPVLDIKPYLPYADAIPDASGGFARPPDPSRFTVAFDPRASRQLERIDPARSPELKRLIEQVLQQDPRPGYMDRYPERTEFGMRLHDVDVRWRLEGESVLVVSVEQT